MLLVLVLFKVVLAKLVKVIADVESDDFFPFSVCGVLLFAPSAPSASVNNHFEK